MKTLLLATTALALGMMSANAADMAARPYTKAAPMMAPSWNWSGFYIGGNVGYGASRSDTGTGAFTAAGTLISGTAGNGSAGGVVGGGQIGWNTMFAPTWLFGIEADIQAADQHGTQTAGLGLNTATPTTLQVDSRLNYFGTVRGRLGWTATPETLLYVTGGYAYGETEVSNTNSGVTGGGAAFLNSGSSKGFKDGWTVGGGVETRLWNSNWTAKFEYLYVDLGTQTAVTRLGGTASTNFQGSSVDFKDHIFRVGLNYKLGNWAY